CLWCDQIQLCSSGTDRNKQDWILRHCDKSAISNETSCPATAHVDAPDGSGKIVYTTDTRQSPTHDTAIVTTVPFNCSPTPQPPRASTFTPVPDVELKRRRPKHVLDDPDDKITTDNVSQQHTHATNTASAPAKTGAPISDVIRTWSVDPYHGHGAIRTK
ncbi:jg17755, partial [Pararge aegeria aegeria]